MSVETGSLGHRSLGHRVNNFGRAPVTRDPKTRLIKSNKLCSPLLHLLNIRCFSVKIIKILVPGKHESSIVIMTLSHVVSGIAYSMSRNVVTLKSGSEVTRGH